MIFLTFDLRDYPCKRPVDEYKDFTIKEHNAPIWAKKLSDGSFQVTIYDLKFKITEMQKQLIVWRLNRV